MFVLLLLLFFAYHVSSLGQQQILILFNKTITVNESDVQWSGFSMLQCVFTTAAETTNTQLTTTVTVTNLVTASSSAALYNCPDGSFGVNCNISSSICAAANPCLNNGTCQGNLSLSLGYTCQCAPGFSGYDCEQDGRLCKQDTCWHNGTCMEINQTIPGYNATTFQCKCLYGYDGLHCQVVSNMCSNITCENQGICISSYLLWSCKCLDATLYSGLYCQEKSSALAAKQALSYSISIAAIIALCCVAAFVLTMDVLKYVFKIDPVDRERHRLEMEREKEEQRKFKARTRPKERVVFFMPTFPLYRL